MLCECPHFAEDDDALALRTVYIRFLAGDCWNVSHGSQRDCKTLAPNKQACSNIRNLRSAASDVGPSSSV